MSQCRSCANAHRRNVWPETKAKELKKRYVNPSHKVCPSCNEDLPIKRFNLKSEITGKREARCGKCRYNERDKDHIKKVFHEWYFNKGGKAKCQAAWEKYKPTRNARIRERKETDPSYKMMLNVRCRIYECIKKRKKNKTTTGRKCKYLCMGPEAYVVWLESMFQDGMTMENHGKIWHIDHVTPCSEFDFDNEEEIYRCFSWENTRPMFIDENLAKSDYIMPDLIEEQELLVEAFKRDIIPGMSKEDRDGIKDIDAIIAELDAQKKLDEQPKRPRVGQKQLNQQAAKLRSAEKAEKKRLAAQERRAKRAEHNEYIEGEIRAGRMMRTKNVNKK